MLAILKQPDVLLSASLTSFQSSTVTPLSPMNFRCSPYQMLHMKINMHNNKETPTKLCLRVLASQHNSVELIDASNCIHWQGPLQEFIPLLAPGTAHTSSIPLLFTSKGRYQILYHTEEVLDPTLEHAALLPPKIVKGKVVPGLYVPSSSERTLWQSMTLEVE